MYILWTIIIGFIVGVIAKFITPGDKNYEPQGFILTTVLGIVGAFVATYLGQLVGWYGPGSRRLYWRCDRRDHPALPVWADRKSPKARLTAPAHPARKPSRNGSSGIAMQRRFAGHVGAAGDARDDQRPRHRAGSAP